MEAHMNTTAPIRAAQYLRMSTEGQEYSLANQSAAIQQYAQSHGFEVVKTYSDAAKSGLVFRNRHGLRQLLQDVVSSDAEYRVILVYDVSRWGRFQDSDEAAHYEFMCKSAGAPVHYCAEQFANDGTLPSLIMKALKRTMAAEFSRELGEKVVAGKKRLALLGYRMGGQPGYGLRRVMISGDGQRKLQLATGQCKSLTTDHVILVPGPERELKWVRWIYAQALAGRRPAAICRELNLRDVGWQDGKPWNLYAVRQVLMNPKYTGCNLYSRTTQKLRTPTRKTPPEQWTTKQDAFAPVIDKNTFDRVQKLLRNKTLFKSDAALLAKLKRFLRTHGRISESMIDRARGLPSVNALRYRFGSIYKVYELIGYRPPRLYARRTERARTTERLRNEVVAALQEFYPGEMTVVSQSRCKRPLLQFRGAGQVVVVMCRYRREPSVGRKYWFLYTRTTERGLPTLVCLLNKRNDAVERFYAMPGIDVLHRLTLTRDDPWFQRGIRLESLADLESALLQMRGWSSAGTLKRRWGCTQPAQLMGPVDRITGV
jgi:DNA invertase Pin-like site-specific DNA recombinase